MQNFRVSPRGLAYFCLFLVLFTAAIKVDGGTGYGNVVWTIMVWSELLVGSLLLFTRLWVSNRDPGAVRRITSQGAYGLLPAKVRDWLFS